jgi:hypothetical protein
VIAVPLVVACGGTFERAWHSTRRRAGIARAPA